MILAATPDEVRRRREVLDAVLGAIAQGVTIRLPAFDRTSPPEPSEVAMVAAGAEPNPFGGHIGPYRYQFEGEDDLLHLMVVRQDRGPLAPEEGQRVAAWLLEGVPPALVWFKPGTVSQHFYVGHDDLAIADNG